MAKSTKSGSGATSSDSLDQESFPSKRELIVITKPNFGLRVSRDGIASVTGADVSSLENVLGAEGVTLKPLFGINEDRIQAKTALLAAETGSDVPDLSVYYQVEAPDERLEELAERLRQLEGIEAAYVKPPAEPAAFRFNDMPPK
jgi:hypothetical protein